MLQRSHVYFYGSTYDGDRKYSENKMRLSNVLQNIHERLYPQLV